MTAIRFALAIVLIVLLAAFLWIGSETRSARNTPLDTPRTGAERAEDPDEPNLIASAVDARKEERKRQSLTPKPIENAVIVHLVLVDGSPAQGVGVTLRHPATATTGAHAVADERGRVLFDLPPGLGEDPELGVEIDSPGYQARSTTSIASRNQVEAGVVHVFLRAIEGSTVRGLVLHSNGEPAAGVVVRAIDGEQTKSDERGRFQLVVASGATADLEAASTERNASVRTQVEVDDDVVLRLVGPSAFHGTAIDAFGFPIVEPLELVWQDAKGASRTRQVLAKKDGSFLAYVENVVSVHAVDSNRDMQPHPFRGQTWEAPVVGAWLAGGIVDALNLSGEGGWRFDRTVDTQWELTTEIPTSKPRSSRHRMRLHQGRVALEILVPGVTSLTYRELGHAPVTLPLTLGPTMDPPSIVVARGSPVSTGILQLELNPDSPLQASEVVRYAVKPINSDFRIREWQLSNEFAEDRITLNLGQYELLWTARAPKHVFDGHWKPAGNRIVEIVEETPVVVRLTE